MAEKILNTRIQLKYDTFENWKNSTFALKKGELAIVEVPTNTPEKTLQPVMFKVGDGTKTFSQLDWASAKAADVYDWAKAAGITVTDEGSGKFVTGFTWNNNALVITRANVTWDDIQNKPDIALKSDLPTELGVMTVTGKDAIVTIGDANVEVSLKLDNTGNVTLSQGANGLKAEVDTGVHAVSLESGTNNGTLKLTVDGTTSDNIAITGLGSAAYTEASAYATNAENGAKAAIDALAEDVGDVDTLETTNKEIVAAINEVRTAVGTGGTAAVVALTKSDDGLTYTLTQGGNSVGTINIPKDMVVKSGEVVANPAGQPEGTYIVLTLANATEDKVYVNVGTLVDIYKAKANAAQVQLAIDSTTREISATIVAGSISATELAADAVTTVKIANGNVTKEKLATTVQASLDLADTAIQEADLGTMAKETATDYVKRTEAPGYDDILTKTVASTTYALKTELPTVNNGKLSISTENGVLTGSGDFTANQTGDTTINIGIADKGITGNKIANYTISGDHIKANKDYTGEDKEVWVFNCGSATTLID